MKRAMDLVISCLVLVVVSPVILCVGALVRGVLGRPVMFRQERLGLGGRSIDVLKFRTMTDDRDAFGQLLDDEHRTPKVGCFLRRTRLDELPSLLAVIKGDMSLVGPRPLPESSYPDGTTQIWRLSLPPGLTGLAQVSGNTLLTPLEKFAIDRHYIRTRSTGLDLVILARTLVTVVAGEKRDEALIGHLVKGPEIGNG